MLVYEKIGFDEVRWSDNIQKFSHTIVIDIPYEDVAERSTDLKLIGLQLIFEHNDSNEGE